MVARFNDVWFSLNDWKSSSLNFTIEITRNLGIRHTTICTFMMTSSNGNIFCVTVPLYGEFTGHRWIPRTKVSDAGLWCLLWSAPEKTAEQPIVRLMIWDAIALIMTSLYWHRATGRLHITGMRLAPSQWETSLQSNAVSHWLGAKLESALHKHWSYCSVHWNKWQINWHEITLATLMSCWIINTNGYTTPL